MVAPLGDNTRYIHQRWILPLVNLLDIYEYPKFRYPGVTATWLHCWATTLGNTVYAIYLLDILDQAATWLHQHLINTLELNTATVVIYPYLDICYPPYLLYPIFSSKDLITTSYTLPLVMCPLHLLLFTTHTILKSAIPHPITIQNMRFRR